MSPNPHVWSFVLPTIVKDCKSIFEKNYFTSTQKSLDFELHQESDVASTILLTHFAWSCRVKIVQVLEYLVGSHWKAHLLKSPTQWRNLTTEWLFVLLHVGDKGGLWSQQGIHVECVVKSLRLHVVVCMMTACLPSGKTKTCNLQRAKNRRLYVFLVIPSACLNDRHIMKSLSCSA